MSEAVDFRAVQEYFGLLSTSPIEKDWHVVRVLCAIGAVDAAPFRLIFAGGTALARAHQFVRRMSEDVDFKVAPLEAEVVSGNKRRQQLGQLRGRITESLQTRGFQIDPSDSTQLRSRDGNRYTIYQLRYDPSDQTKAPLRPSIQLEFTYAQLRHPSVRLPVSSFVAEALEKSPEVPEIECVSLTEKAAEKLVSLTRRTAMELAGLSRQADPTLVRHIYDLHSIRDAIDSAKVVELARLVALQDAEVFKNQYPAYLNDISGELVQAAWP